MRTVRAAETAVSIWFSGESAPPWGELTALVRRALARQGLPVWETVEAECFAAGRDTLVIARPGRERRMAFYFEDLEALLGGALAAPAGESALYRDGEGYRLTVAAEAACPALYEYGAPRRTDGLWEVHAREQGLCLMEKNALADLRRCFSR